MAGKFEWVLLAYRLPREPSTPRINVWRKLKRLGVAQVVDGLVALPADARSREKLEWIAAEAIDAGGVASIWLGRLTSARQEQELAAAMTTAVSAEYEAVREAAVATESEPDATRRRTLARLRRELGRIGERDYFPPDARETAHRAVEALASTLVDV
jgi:hypothetical protein